MQFPFVTRAKYDHELTEWSDIAVRYDCERNAELNKNTHLRALLRAAERKLARFERKWVRVGGSPERMRYDRP